MIIYLEDEIGIDAIYIIGIFIVLVLFQIGFERFIFKFRPTFFQRYFCKVDELAY